jgi:hypothetical protein
MITKDAIAARRTVLERDIATVRERLAGHEKNKQEDTALINALTGAFQQCEAFLQELDDVKPEMASDDGNDEKE